MNLSLLSKALSKERPPCSPKSGPLWRQASVSRVLLSMTFGIPSKGALPPGSPHKAPSERDARLLEPSFIHPSTSTVYEPHPGSPVGPLWREMPVSRAFFYTSSRVPKEKVPPPPGSPRRAPSERDALHLKPPSTISQSPR